MTPCIIFQMNYLFLGTLDLSTSVRWAEETASQYVNEKTQRGSGPRRHVSASLGLEVPWCLESSASFSHWANHWVQEDSRTWKNKTET